MLPMHRRIRTMLLGAALVTSTLAFGSVANADASTQLLNAAPREFGGPDLAMEVAGDGRVFLKPSNPASFRQQWDREQAVGDRFRYRNLAVNACLVVPQAARPATTSGSGRARASGPATSGSARTPSRATARSSS